MFKVKKLINETDAVVSQMVAGIEAAHGSIRRIPDTNSLVRSSAGEEDKVAVVSGGGSGHEPAHAGYIGTGMLDGVACGEVFTSPSADQIAELYEEVDSGRGVLAVVKNYQGDVMNFRTAADLAGAKGIDVEQVVVDDDVAVEDSEHTTGRRGVCGTVLVHKVAGAVAERGGDVGEVQAAAESVIDNVATMGMALTSCVTPESGSPTFDIEDDEMEMGIGIHGEPGIERTAIEPAETVAEQLTDAVTDDLGVDGGDEVAVIVNGMGGTPLSELYIVNRTVQEILDDRGVEVWNTWVGEYMTSLEMAGCSVTVLELDEERKSLLEEPARTPGFTVV